MKCKISPIFEVARKIRRHLKQRKTRWVKISSGQLKGHKILLNVDGDPYFRKMMEGTFESFLYEAIKQYRDLGGWTIWDVGGHIGYHALAFAKLVGDSGKVIVFEPNPFNIKRMKLNFKKNHNLAQYITLVEYALSDTDGEAVFNISKEIVDGTSSGSYLGGVSPPLSPESYHSFFPITVRTIKADTLLSMSDIPVPHMIKIDVEGAEALVLKGGFNLLSKYRPILFIEIHSALMLSFVQEFLPKLGYKIKTLHRDPTFLERCFILAELSGKVG